MIQSAPAAQSQLQWQTGTKWLQGIDRIPSKNGSATNPPPETREHGATDACVWGVIGTRGENGSIVCFAFSMIDIFFYAKPMLSNFPRSDFKNKDDT